MATRVAVVEDDSQLRALLLRGLKQEGFEVAVSATGTDLLEQARREPPDALVIDIGLPDTDGRDLCQALRAAGVDAPVLFLTARGALSDRLSGFHMGGDDYLTKPFAFEELIVRLRALLRRSGEADGRDGTIHLDPATHAVHTPKGAVALTPTEFRILAALAARPGEVVRRRELVAAAWPDGAVVHDNTLDAYIARIRRKLRNNEADSSVATAHGVGYRLE